LRGRSPSSIVRTGHFIYGKRQCKPLPLIAGALLCTDPYFSDSLIWLCGVGALLAAAPFVLDF